MNHKSPFPNPSRPLLTSVMIALAIVGVFIGVIESDTFAFAFGVVVTFTFLVVLIRDF